MKSLSLTISNFLVVTHVCVYPVEDLQTVDFSIFPSNQFLPGQLDSLLGEEGCLCPDAGNCDSFTTS